MAVMLLRVAGEQYRGRIMGVRMLAIYGLPVGLLNHGQSGFHALQKLRIDRDRRPPIHLHRRHLRLIESLLKTGQADVDHLQIAVKELSHERPSRHCTV